MHTINLKSTLVALAAASAFAALPIATQANAAPAAKKLIVPGKSVAGVSLGDTTAQVRRVLGKPEGGGPFNYRYLKRHGIGVYFVADRATDIMVTKPSQVTPKGIRVGSLQKALTKAYRGAKCQPALVGKRTVECRLAARFRGRATETLFTVKAGKVASITVHFA